MTTLELLQKARKRIANKKRWTQRAFARGVESLPEGVHSRHAKSWCALGACQVECRFGPDNMPVYHAAMAALQSTTYGEIGVSHDHPIPQHTLM